VWLAYRLRSEPSTPRISVWRKLKRLGAVQLVDGLVALPGDPATVEAFDWLADEVVEAGGVASLWLAEAATRAIERELIEQLRARVAEEYRSVLAAVEHAGGAVQGRTLARLRRELQRIARRDFFPPPERELARRAVADASRTERVR